MTKAYLHEHLAILDFGSQYTHLISRRLRDAHVFSKIYPHEVSASQLNSEHPIGIILSGGPKSVYDADATIYDSDILTLGLPILGICYGHQLIARHFGGDVKRGKTGEYGFATLKFKVKSSKSKVTSTLFTNVSNNLQVWMSHGDAVTKLPPGFEIIGKTKNCSIAAMADAEKNIYGLQFHPEVHHTKDEDKILWNFAFRICKAKGDWKMRDIIADISQELRAQARTKKVFMLVSGGVDSTVAFVLLQKTLGKKQVFGIHIDSGLMRKNESREIVTALKKAGLANITTINGEEYFLKRLFRICDPEEKRVIIGEAYLYITQKWLKTHYKETLKNNDWLMGQGTIYPDTIESGGTSESDKIKTHHNRIAKIVNMIEQGKVIEPLKNLYKDEVRNIGEKLGLPKELLFRHPFPGPGLAIMALCSQDHSRLPRLHLPEGATILPVKSTGVQGDSRTYAYPLAVWNKWNFPRLSGFATDFTNRNKKINRVVQVVWTRGDQAKTPPRFHHTPGLFITKDRLELLRKIHERITTVIKNDGLYDKIWEFPIVLLPVGITKKGQSIVLRPISSKEAMTVNAYQLPTRIIKRITAAIAKFSEIEAIFYDATNKPPATIQWE